MGVSNSSWTAANPRDACAPTPRTPRSTSTPRANTSSKRTGLRLDSSRRPQGDCEVLTRRARQLASGDEAQIDGVAGPHADQRRRLAQYPRTLGRTARLCCTPGGRPLRDPALRYSAARLEGNGSWLSVDSQYAWQPQVASTWRPYWNGRWRYTPSGLTWVSGESWGWLTHHYGNWDYRREWLALVSGTELLPGVGLLVLGPDPVGWCPTGYYSHYYKQLFRSRCSPGRLRLGSG